MSNRPKVTPTANGKAPPQTWEDYFRSPQRPVTRGELGQFLAVHVRKFHGRPWWRRLLDRLRRPR